MGVLNGKTAIITGGASGIGREIAKRFFEEAANVVLFDMDQEKLAEAKGEISANDERIIAVRGDVREDEAIQLAVASAKKFGAVDILVNCAGVLHFGKLDQTEPSVWDRLMRINAFGPWRFMVAVLPAMREGGGGSIINISSINGIKAFPGAAIWPPTDLRPPSTLHPIITSRHLGLL
jgi:NAD(P)-dependent dehydrogenase (short-subunit alcohol dehydrogenase family)